MSFAPTTPVHVVGSNDAVPNGEHPVPSVMVVCSAPSFNDRPVDESANTPTPIIASAAADAPSANLERRRPKEGGFSSSFRAMSGADSSCVVVVVVGIIIRARASWGKLKFEEKGVEFLFSLSFRVSKFRGFTL